MLERYEGRQKGQNMKRKERQYTEIHITNLYYGRPSSTSTVSLDMGEEIKFINELKKKCKKLVQKKMPDGSISVRILWEPGTSFAEMNDAITEAMEA